jgi:hypothetical protein
MRRIAVAFWLVLAVTLAGCAGQLKPAPDARLTPGRAPGAVAEEAGVKVVARAEAWRGYPEDLWRQVTPMLVTVENGSRVRLRIRYADFALVTPSEQRFAALAPFDIRGTLPEREPMGLAHPFLLDPYHGRFFPYRGAIHPFAFDPFYYDRFWPGWQRWVSLPTGDMVQKALPEGVVEPGGRATGFVYFELVEDTDRVSLRADLVNADTGAKFVSLVIPFVVH